MIVVVKTVFAPMKRISHLLALRQTMLSGYCKTKI